MIFLSGGMANIGSRVYDEHKPNAETRGAPREATMTTVNTYSAHVRCVTPANGSDIIAANALAFVYAALRQETAAFAEQLAELPDGLFPRMRAEWAALSDERRRGFTRDMSLALLDALAQDLRIPEPDYAAHGGVYAWRRSVHGTYIVADYFVFPGILRQPLSVLVTYVWAIETLGGGKQELSRPARASR